jgi:hypothetical protein
VTSGSTTTTSATTTAGTTSTSSTAGTSTGAGTTTGSGTTGSTTSGGGTGPIVIDAGADQTFAGVAVAFAGNEGELFFTETADGGYVYLLQHLSAAGAAVDSPVIVAFGVPMSPPAVAVSSDGTEIAACWEDFGLNPNHYGGACFADGESGAIVRCNSIPLAGTATDLALDGGYVGCGVRPFLEQGTSGFYDYTDLTFLTYSRPGSDTQLDSLYCGWGNSISAQTPPSIGAEVVAEAAGYWIFLGAPDELVYNALNLGSGPCSGITYGPPYNSVLKYDGGQAFSVTGRADDGGSQIGIVISAASTGVVGLVYDDPTVRVAIPPSTLNAADESPLGLIALAGCGAQFWYAYAVDGGTVMAGAMNVDGGLVDGGASRVGNLGTNATSLSMATSDGGLLLAVGTPGQIAVFFIPCP